MKVGEFSQSSAVPPMFFQIPGDFHRCELVNQCELFLCQELLVIPNWLSSILAYKDFIKFQLIASYHFAWWPFFFFSYVLPKSGKVLFHLSLETPVTLVCLFGCFDTSTLWQAQKKLFGKLSIFPELRVGAVSSCGFLYPKHEWNSQTSLLWTFLYVTLVYSYMPFCWVHT